MVQSWLAANSNNSCNVNCIQEGSLALTVISCIASIIGSLLIIGTFLWWKDLRTIARMILVFLAIADLFTALGYLFGAAVYIQFYYTQNLCHNDSSTWDNHTHDVYNTLCTVQSFLTTLMPMASFFWTGNLAVYLFFSLAWQRAKFTKTLMAIFHTIAWGIPLVTCVFIVSFDRFGPSLSRSSGGWCWIKFKPYNSTFSGPKERSVYIAAELMAGKVWEISVGIVALLAYIGVKIMAWRRFSQPKKASQDGTQYSSISMEKKLQAAYTKVDQKLIWLPIAFLLLRMWGTIRFFISIHCPFPDSSQHCCHLVYNQFLIYMQSFCDPGQGWSNALLFVIFNEKILHRLCPCLEPLEKWCGVKVRRILPKRRRKPPRVINRVNVVATDVPERGQERHGDRDPLLNESLRSNISSSVLYSAAVPTPNGSDRNVVVKSRNPSINSKV